MIFGDDAAQPRLKWAFDSCKNGAWGDEPDGESDAVCIRAADFNADLGVLLDSERTLRAIDDATYRKVGLRAGDLVVEKSGGGEKQLVGRSVIYNGTDRAVCSNFLARCRPSDLVTSEYLNYLMLGIYKARGTYPHIKQTTGIQNLDMASLLNTRVTLPRLETQRRIAAFLDEKTAQIDTLVARKQALLARLAEKRQAIITQAVTKGLNPTAPLKDSGIEWLGQIPAHWEVVALRRMASRVATGRTPAAAAGDFFTDGEVPWFTPGDFKGALVLGGSEKCLTHDAFIEGHAVLYPANSVLLVGIGATLGKVAVAPLACSSNQQINAITPLPDTDAIFLAYFLHGFRNEVRVTANGNTLPILNQDKTKAIAIVRPTHGEQTQISAHLLEADRRIEFVSSKIVASIDLLNEERATLITRAVTGQIEGLR